MSSSLSTRDEEASLVNESYSTFASSNISGDALSNAHKEYLGPGQELKSLGMAYFKGVAMVATVGLVVLAGIATFPQTPAVKESMLVQVKTEVSATSKPNFVFVLADDVSWNSFGYVDYDLSFATPFMTSLAKSGVIMTNYYSQEVCTPARASLMTGRYPATVGMQYGEVRPNSDLALNIDEILLPEILRDQGYKNYALGKWNLGHYNPQYLPTARGFDYFLGYMDGVTYYWSKKNPYTPQYTDFTYSDTECYNVYDGVDATTYSTSLYTDKAVGVIKTHDFTSNPMFLYMAYQAGHDPYSDEGESYEDGMPMDYVGQERYDQVTKTVVGMKRQQYALSLMVLDDSVQRLYSALEEVNQLENTYIIVTSDNGGCHNAGGRNGPLRGSKGTLYEGGTKVDAFIYSAKLSQSAGSSYNGLMHVSDWFPTMLGWAGFSYTASEGHQLDGFDHSSVLSTVSTADQTSYPRQTLLYNMYTNVDGKDFDMSSNSPVAIRDKQYKLIHAYTGSKSADWFSVMDEEGGDDSFSDLATCSQDDALEGEYQKFLFDLINDPFEMTDLYNDEKYAEVKSQLYAALDQISVKLTATGSEHGEATTQWADNAQFVQPWNFDVLPVTTSTRSTPALCSNLNHVFSPQY